MPIAFSTQETAELTASLKRYFSSELEHALTDLHARMLLNYFAKEIAPLAYNQGVKDAEGYFRNKLEDLPAVCFEAPLTYWQKKRK